MKVGVGAGPASPTCRQASSTTNQRLVWGLAPNTERLRLKIPLF